MRSGGAQLASARRAGDNDHAIAIKDMLPYHAQKWLSIEPPFPRNDQLVYRTMSHGDNITDLKIVMQKTLTTKQCKIKRQDLKASVELSPERQQPLSASYAALGHVQKQFPNVAVGS